MLTSKIGRQVILIVDADADSRQIYTQFLRHHGFDVVPVSSGSEALSAAAAADAIVTEIRLPSDVDGLAMVKRLKQDARTSGVPLIVVTSSAWSTDRARAEAAGCDLFLTKPCLPQDVMQAVRRVIARRKLDERAKLAPARSRHLNRLDRTWRPARRVRSVRSLDTAADRG